MCQLVVGALFLFDYKYRCNSRGGNHRYATEYDTYDCAHGQSVVVVGRRGRIGYVGVGLARAFDVEQQFYRVGCSVVLAGDVDVRVAIGE